MAGEKIIIAAGIDSTGAKQGANEFNSALSSMGLSTRQMSAALRGFGIQAGAVRAGLIGLAGFGIARVARAAVEASDNFAALATRIALVSDKGGSASATLAGIGAAADRARTPASDLAKAYAAMGASLEEAGRTQGQSIAFTENLSKVIQLSGVEAAKTGEELAKMAAAVSANKIGRADLERLPELMRILREQTGLSERTLKEFADAGRISGKTVSAALLNATDEINAKFAALPRSAGVAFQQLTDAVQLTTGEIAKQAGVSESFAALWDRLREAIGSPEFAAAAKRVAEGIAAIGDALRSFIDLIAEAKVRYEAWKNAITDTGIYKASAHEVGLVTNALGLLWDNLKRDWAEAAPGRALAFGGEVQAFATLKASADDYANSIRTVAQLRGTLKADEPIVANAPAKKLPVTFAATKGDDDIKRQIELEKMKGELIRAELADNRELERSIRTQMEIRNRISDELRRSRPDLARQLEAEIKTTAELERQKLEFTRLREIGSEFATTLSDGIMGAVKAGKNFGETLRDVTAQMIELIVKTAILKPMADSIGRSFAGAFSGTGFGGFLADPAGATAANDGGLGGLFSGLTSGLGLPFADGGIIGGPTRWAGGGAFGVAGEAGPEAVLPLKRGADGALGVSMSGAGGGTTNIVVNVAGDATAETVAKIRAIWQNDIASAQRSTVAASVNAVRAENLRDPRFLRR